MSEGSWADVSWGRPQGCSASHGGKSHFSQSQVHTWDPHEVLGAVEDKQQSISTITLIATGTGSWAGSVFHEGRNV